MDEEAAAALRAAGVPDRLARLLPGRGVRDLETAEAFLSPSLDQLHDPSLLAGLPEAVERLAAALSGGEKVAVVGDYDVDGVSATALLLAIFGACGLAAEAILPHRLKEGYGFQPVHVERAAEKGIGLIVTVDCGTSSNAAVTAAAAAGIDVIVTDHHLPGGEEENGGLPAGALLVNPRQAGCAYPFPDLAGVGLALKLAQAFAAACGRDLSLPQLLRIACLGTIADMVPLVGENRVIAALGLASLGETRSPGLLALIKKAGVRKPLKADDIGFRLGPRLNAAGRLDSPDSALELLLCRDPRRAEELARQLDSSNRQRQEEEARVVAEATEAIGERAQLPAMAVAWSESWHRGVVGIAAGRLARSLCRPTLLLSVDGDTATGSGRSVPGIGLHDFLDRWRGDYLRFGGHDQAIGMTVEVARLEELRQRWEEAAAADFPPELLVKRYRYDLELTAEETGGELLGELARLEPFGQGNPQPLLRIGPLSLKTPPRLFGKGHLSAVARGDGGGSVYLVGWGWGERREELGGRFEVLGHLEYDSYRGAPSLRLRDARPLPE